MEDTPGAARKPAVVLITSVGSGVGYGALYAFSRSARAYRVVGLNSEPMAAGNFRCDSVYAICPASRAGEYRQRIEEVLRRERPQLVIPGHDLELPLLAAWRSELEQQFNTTVLVSHPDVIRVCNDKFESAAFFGLRFVASAVEPADVAALIERVGFPLIVKPRQGYASRGISVVFDRQALAAALADSAGELVVQEYLVPDAWPRSRAEIRRTDVYRDGQLRQEEEYSVQVLVGRGGQILGLFGSRHSLAHGVPMRIETFRDPALEAEVLAMTQQLIAIGLIGPCNFQARRVAGGTYRFFEINARFTGITPARADMGFNECDAAYAHWVDGVDASASLECREGLLAQRYITHDVFTAEQLQSLKVQGQWPASI